MGLFKHCCGSEPDCRPSGRRGRALHFAGHALLGLAVVVVVALLFGWVVMTAWNAVIPATFNLPSVGYWQAVALLVLGRVLTGRFHHRRDGSHGWHRTMFRHADFRQWWERQGEAAYHAFRAGRTGGTAD